MHGYGRRRTHGLGPRAGLLVWVALFCTHPFAIQATGFSSERASFSVKFREQVSPYRVIGVFLLPGEVLELEVLILEHSPKGEYSLRTSDGKITQKGATKWEWRAPGEKGLYVISVVEPQATDSVTLNAFVMVPYSELRGEHLNGYRIGRYPVIPLKGLPIYRPPRGFIEVTPENEQVLVGPHFGLQQFLCKQPAGYPKYLVLRERLILKLELVLEKVNAKGYECSTLHIMSGYRTPYYNRAIGDVKYSRHVWGGAADIFIDENPKDGMMDDLNRDGRIDYRDAAVLYDIVDALFGEVWYKPFVGGLGRYKKTPSHGPFVHVDVRGFRARWGH